MTNRLAVYCFYDKDGIVDDYVIFFLRNLRQSVAKICCVVNGELTESGREALSTCTDELLERANTGFDAGAYAFFVNSRIDEIRQYDELVFCNNSFFGPLYPLENVFGEMDSRAEKSDFWGMTIHPRIDFVIDKSQKLKYVNEHVQSYFVVFTKKVICSRVFASFFKNLPEIKTFHQAVCLYELELTRVLSEAGFTYSAFADSKGLPETDCTVLYPDLLVREKRHPFVKRKVFFAPYENFFAAGRGQNSRKCLDYVKNNTNYDVKLIWQHLLRTQKMSVLRQNLDLNYILSSDISTGIANPSVRAALVCYVYYPENVPELLSYARSCEGIADLYFVSSRDDTIEMARKILGGQAFRFKKTELLKKINKGRDLSTYLIDCAHLFDSYDYLCFVHDKKSPHLANQQVTHDFFRMCIESMLCSKAYVTNLLNAFETHLEFGVAVMPPLNFGPFYTSDYFMNPGNMEHIKGIMKELNLNVPYDESPVAPYGDMFWCRTAAMSRLFRSHWTYDNLPDEPVPADGTILHALERIHPFVAQASGYYTAWVHPDTAAATYMNNLYYIARTLNEKLFSVYGYANLPQLVSNIQNSGAGVKDDSAWHPGFIELLRYRYRRHVVRHLLKENRKEFAEFYSGKTEIWDAGYYLKEYPDVAEVWDSPLEHYVKHGWRENRSPSAGCRTDDYLKINQDCGLLGISPLEHYFLCRKKGREVFWSYEDMRTYAVRHGLEILRKSASFDPEFYRKEYERKHGSVPAGFEPYSYYLEHGALETVKPGRHFRVHSYFDMFPYLKTYGICPVVHYELLGKYLGI